MVVDNKKERIRLHLPALNVKFRIDLYACRGIYKLEHGLRRLSR